MLVFGYSDQEMLKPCTCLGREQYSDMNETALEPGRKPCVTLTSDLEIWDRKIGSFGLDL